MTKASPGGILLHIPTLQGIEAQVAEYGPVTRLWEQDDPLAFARSEAGKAIRVVVTISIPPLDRALLDALEGLQAIVVLGAGYESIDTDWARERGIMVANSPGLGAEDVADAALGMMLASLRRIVEGDALVRSGGWTHKYRGPAGIAVGGRRIGIVGLGAIGKAVARRAQACRGEVRWWGRRPRPEADWPQMADLGELADWAQVLVVCVALNGATRHLIDADIIRRLGPEGLLVNISRGGTVDEDALRAALRSGELGMAALDVFTTEPTDPALWAGVPNTILTPHSAGWTMQSVIALRDQAVANVIAVLTEGRVLTPVSELA
ncbi:2-hydroxyacid dehydrogenase [Novosphingobium bradum]|uniref:2-hydroxyacid dehydrogenase n=1 Tax=Novosphingobium bradum TaxID=1737444 RepID=A0ABV7ILL8_9SPHN